MPGDEIKVELSYTELLVPTEAVYEFVYPTVVGPRYSNQPAAGAPDTERWVENPYHHQGEAPTYDFDIKVTLAAGMPIQKVACASHKTSVSYDGPTVATVTPRPIGAAGRQPRLRAAVPAGRLPGRVGAPALPGQGRRELLSPDGPAAEARGRSSRSRHASTSSSWTSRGRCTAIPLEVSKKLLARPDRAPAAHRHVQRPAVLRRLERDVRAVVAGHTRERRTRHQRHRAAAGRRRHRAPAGPAARPRPPPHRGRLAHRRDRHRRLRGRGEGGVRPHPRQPRQRPTSSPSGSGPPSTAS